MLDAQVVLVGAGRSQMRIHEKDAAAAVDGQETRVTEIKIRRRRVRGKRIGYARSAERVGQIVGGTSLSERWEIHADAGKEWRLPVELQIVFALQNVVEQSKSAADAGLGIAARIPRETDARRPIRVVREISSPGRAGIAGEDHPGWSARKDGRLQARDN